MEIPDNFTTLVTLLTGAVSFILQKAIRDKSFRDNLLKGIKKLFRMFKGTELLSHYIFDTAKLYIQLSKNIKFTDNCERKSLFFEALFLSNINATISVIQEWLNDNFKNINKFNAVSLQTEFLSILKKIETENKKLISESFFKILENRFEADKTFNIIYYGSDNENDIGFKTYIDNNSTHLLNYIKNLPIYFSLSNTQLVTSFLNELEAILRASVVDAKEVFERKNGRLCKDEIK